MFKSVAILEVKAGTSDNERIHRYECPPETPYGEVYDSLCAMKAFVLEEMKKQADKELPTEVLEVQSGNNDAPPQECTVSQPQTECK